MSETLILTFEVGGYCRGNQTVNVYQLEDGSYRSDCIRMYSSVAGLETDKLELALEQATIDEFVEKAEAMGVFEWEPKYYAKMLDGQDWKLAIDLPDHPKVTCRGLSSYPSKFYQFLKLLEPLGLK